MPFSRKRKASQSSQRSTQPKSYSVRAGLAKRRKTVWAKRTEGRISRLERTIETKEGLRTFSGGKNIAIQHNNIYTLTNSLLFTNYGTGDPMAGVGLRIGDRICFRGVAIKLMLQNQAERPKVFYRVMVIKSAKGDAPTRATLFKGLTGDPGNKMIDQINTERYTIIAQKSLNCVASGAAAWTTVNATGVPRTENGATQIGGVGTKIVSMWIPGRKLARNGVVTYENESTQPKFFDYHLIILAYDWFGTPQDVNNVGAVSDGWVKLYYRDA